MEIKTLFISMKNPSNCPIKSFVHLKKNNLLHFQKERCINSYNLQLNGKQGLFRSNFHNFSGIVITQYYPLYLAENISPLIIVEISPFHDRGMQKNSSENITLFLYIWKENICILVMASNGVPDLIYNPFCIHSRKYICVHLYIYLHYYKRFDLVHHPTYFFSTSAYDSSAN